MEKQVNRTTDDLISRAEAIRLIDEYWELQKRLGKPSRGMADVKQTIKVIINSLQTAQQWHTGEPTESGDYLCYVKYDMTDGGSHEWFEHGYEVCAYYDTDGSFEGDYAGWQSYGIVLAWMPLPEAPEVEE